MIPVEPLLSLSILKEDPPERMNLADRYSEIVVQLANFMKASHSPNETFSLLKSERN
jgi:hypothetical protein